MKNSLYLKLATRHVLVVFDTRLIIKRIVAVPRPMKLAQNGQLTRVILQRAQSTIEVGERSHSKTIFTRYGKRYAILTEHVIEVMRDVAIHSVPLKTLKKFLGIAHYHGEICPCLEVGDVQNYAPFNYPTTALVFTENDKTYFLMIDAIEEISDESHEAIDVEPQTIIHGLMESKP